MMIPKSTAPSDSRLALMPIRCRQIKANSKARGIMMDTISVVRQLNMKRDTSSVTNKMPSTRLWRTVCVA